MREGPILPEQDELHQEFAKLCVGCSAHKGGNCTGHRMGNGGGWISIPEINRLFSARENSHS